MSTVLVLLATKAMSMKAHCLFQVDPWRVKTACLVLELKR